MQKVIRATERAKTQARRKNLFKQERQNARRRSLLKLQQDTLSKDTAYLIKAARLARREDWLLGPLAPRRDLGSSKDTYGTVSPRIVEGVRKSGPAHDYCITAGDRVVIVGKFPEKGRIGTVTEVRAKAETCIVKGFNLVDIAVPTYMLEENQEIEGSQKPDPVLTKEAPIPLSAVRLVYPLRDQRTGTFRDVIIKKLERTPASERRKGVDPRYIADTEPQIHIPLPKVEEKKDELPEHEIDTLRIEVEEKTWTPTLNQPPMPPSVIDELRNKYSIFRDRHDDSWVRARETSAAEREKAAREREVMMLTPLEELRRLRKLERSKVMKEPLNSETLMLIGELMARHKERLAREEVPRMV